MATLGDQSIDEQYREVMHGLAQEINFVLNGDRRIQPTDRRGFVLMVFPLTPPGEKPSERRRINYIGNGERRDIVRALEEQARRFRKLEREGK